MGSPCSKRSSRRRTRTVLYKSCHYVNPHPPSLVFVTTCCVSTPNRTHSSATNARAVYSGAFSVLGANAPRRTPSHENQPSFTGPLPCPTDVTGTQERAHTAFSAKPRRQVVVRGVRHCPGMVFTPEATGLPHWATAHTRIAGEPQLSFCETGKAFLRVFTASSLSASQGQYAFMEAHTGYFDPILSRSQQYFLTVGWHQQDAAFC